MKHARLAVSIGFAAVIGCNARFDFDVPFEAGALSCTDKCAQWHQLCAENWQVCVECNVDNDCTGNANGSRCSSSHRCVHCIDNTDCPLGSCVTAINDCQQACSQASNDDVCDTDGQKCGTQGNCLECNGDDDCKESGRGAHCLSCGYCAGCTSNADCLNGSAPLCDLVLRQCVACIDGRNCSSGCCDLSTHQCY
jgi:hypothetical protein